MEDVATRVKREFEARFAKESRLFRAPGRVNLIGEHTDYNDGFVLPFAIDRETVVAATMRNDSTVNAVALDLADAQTFDISDAPVKERGSWLDYVEGTIRSIFEHSGPNRSGVDMVIASTVPIGAGLSSSAALEVAVGLAYCSLNRLDISPSQLALAAQRAEHMFVGIRSGIMDQFTSVLAKRGHALLLDCRSREIDYISLELGDSMIAVVDTKVEHELASSEYNRRRAECEEGVAVIRTFSPEVASLRDVDHELLSNAKHAMRDVVYHRCRHVVSENIRTQDAARLFAKGDHAEVGERMFESHESLRHDYDVSCAELDVLVETARTVPGVFGARMTGGGFGGCTVNLLRRDSFQNFAATLSGRYEKEFGSKPDIYEFKAVDGASEIARV